MQAKMRQISAEEPASEETLRESLALFQSVPLSFSANEVADDLSTAALSCIARNLLANSCPNLKNLVLMNIRLSLVWIIRPVSFHLFSRLCWTRGVLLLLTVKFISTLQIWTFYCFHASQCTALLVEYYIGYCYNSLPSKTPSDRLKNLQSALRAYDAFLSHCFDYGLAKTLATQDAAPTDPAAARMRKIALFKEERSLRARIDALNHRISLLSSSSSSMQTPANGPRDDFDDADDLEIDDDLEDLQRTLVLQQINLSILSARQARSVAIDEEKLLSEADLFSRHVSLPDLAS